MVTAESDSSKTSTWNVEGGKILHLLEGRECLEQKKIRRDDFRTRTVHVDIVLTYDDELAMIDPLEER